MTRIITAVFDGHGIPCQAPVVDHITASVGRVIDVELILVNAVAGVACLGHPSRHLLVIAEILVDEKVYPSAGQGEAYDEGANKAR